MDRSRVKPFVISIVVVAVAIGVLTLLLPIRKTYGAGSLRCEDFGSGGNCPTELLVDRLVGASVLVAALITPALVLFAFTKEGRLWSLARGVWVFFLSLYWVVALFIGLYALTAADYVKR